MIGKPVARISWNRVSREITYTSVNETPKFRIIFKQQNTKFVVDDMSVDSNGYQPRDLQNKLNAICRMINKKYEKCIK